MAGTPMPIHVPSELSLRSGCSTRNQIESRAATNPRAMSVRPVRIHGRRVRSLAWRIRGSGALSSLGIATFDYHVAHCTWRP
jgi:hypothetical protein